MSWPSDGLPRFKVGEVVGQLAGGRAGRDAHLNATYVVMDRADCHRAVWQAHSEDYSRCILGVRRPLAVSMAHADALGLAARLERESAADGA